MAHVYSVGQPYHPGRTSWADGCDYNLRRGQHELRLFARNPSDAEVAGAARGPCRFGVYTEGPAIFFLYRFDGFCGWSDQPFTWHLVPEEERTDPAALAGERALVTVLLVDGATGILRAIRAVTLNGVVSSRLHAAIQDQALQPWDELAFGAAVGRVQARHSAEKMAGLGTTCRGGE